MPCSCSVRFCSVLSPAPKSSKRNSFVQCCRRTALAISCVILTKARLSEMVGKSTVRSLNPDRESRPPTLATSSPLLSPPRRLALAGDCNAHAEPHLYMVTNCVLIRPRPHASTRTHARPRKTPPACAEEAPATSPRQAIALGLIDRLP